MTFIGEIFPLGSRVTAPKNENRGSIAQVEFFDDLVRKYAPTNGSVAVGLMLPDREGRV